MYQVSLKQFHINEFLLNELNLMSSLNFDFHFFSNKQMTEINEPIIKFDRAKIDRTNRDVEPEPIEGYVWKL